MKKYYGYFIYGDREFVIRFKIDGSLQWDQRSRCFVDKDWYVRGIEELISHVAFGTHPSNLHIRFWGLKITHKEFIRQRSNGVKRWIPENEIIKWD